MTKRFVTGLFAFAILVIAPLAASAATDTFMLVPGIPGGSFDDRHRDWIDVVSLQQSWPGTVKKGTSCEVTVVKALDISGPKLWLAAVTGQVFGEIKIEAIKAGGEQFKFYELKLLNAQISSITTNVTGPSVVENVVISPQSATLSFFPQKGDGSAGPAVTVTVPCN
jgi:type VI secretion system Hcp family effector